MSMLGAQGKDINFVNKEKIQMALTDESGVNVSMPVAPVGYPMYGNGGFGGFGNGDWSWIIILLLFGMFGGYGGFGGGFGGGGMLGLYPWLLNDNTQNGFTNAGVTGQLNGIQNAITTGFSNAEVANCGRTIDALNRSFDSQTAITSALYGVNNSLQNCCCENRLGLANLGSDIAREACADRAAVNDALRDVIAANTASTQRILDQMCSDKIDQKNEKIADLERQLTMANLAASQTAQNAFISQGLTNEVDALYNRLSNCPVPTVPVYGRQPIFTCGNNGGCGCGSNGFTGMA